MDLAKLFTASLGVWWLNGFAVFKYRNPKHIVCGFSLTLRWKEVRVKKK
jgi:hypothetical protein